TKRGSFDLFEGGLTLSKQLDDRLRIGMQLLGFRHGMTGDYKAKVDWAYLDYHARDWIGVRAGRIKIPFGLYNDTADIDAADPTSLLPQSVYPFNNRDYLLAQTGAEIYGYRQLDPIGAFEYRLYGGSIYLDLPTQPGPITILKFEVPYVVGGRLMWETPLEGLRIGASLQYLRVDTSLLDQRIPAMPMQIDARIPARLYVASIEYARDDALFAAEYSRWRTEIQSSNQMVLPDSEQNVIRAYGLMAYRVRPWIQPALSYSVYYPETGKDIGPSAKQHDA